VLFQFSNYRSLAILHSNITSKYTKNSRNKMTNSLIKNPFENYQLNRKLKLYNQNIYNDFSQLLVIEIYMVHPKTPISSWHCYNFQLAGNTVPHHTKAPTFCFDHLNGDTVQEKKKKIEVYKKFGCFKCYLQNFVGHQQPQSC
jgi:hypothetical protein